MRWLAASVGCLFAALLIILSTAASALITVGALRVPGAIDVEVVGQFAYVVDDVYFTDDSGFRVVDISNPAEPVLASSFVTQGLARSAAVVDELLYLAVWGCSSCWPEFGPTLRVIDVSNPLAPIEIGAIELDEYPTRVSTVAVANGRAYVGGSFGLKIVDVSNPDEIVEIAALDRAAIGYPSDVTVVGTRLYVAFSSSDHSTFPPTEHGGLRIIDISEPAAPVELGSHQYIGFTTGLAVSGNLACVTGGAFGSRADVRVIDISNSAAPVELSIIETPGIADMERNVEIVSSLAYVADGTGLRVIDISNPTLPVDIGGLWMTHNSYLGVNDVVVLDGLAYVANGHDLRVVDLSEVAFPREVGLLTTPGDPIDVEVENDVAYLTDGDLRIADVSNPTAPAELSSLDAGDARLVETADGLVYVAEGGTLPNDKGSLRIVEVSNPTTPVQLASLPLPGWPTDMEVADGRAYVTLNLELPWYGPAGLSIVDVSDASTPRELASLEFYKVADDATVAVEGEFAYVAIYNRNRTGPFIELMVIDVSVPTEPFKVGSLQYPGRSGGSGALEVVDGIAYYAFLRGWSPFLHTIDVTNPAAPTELGRVWTLDLGSDLGFVDGLIYVAAGYAGLRVIDVSDPTAPLELGAFAPYPYAIARSIAVADQLSYVTDVENDAMRVIDFGPQYARTLEIDLDIKPGSDSNPINFSIEGVIPVAILGSAAWDVADVDQTTLAFGPGGAPPAHCHGPHIEDVNGDGYPDLLSHFQTDQPGIAFGVRTACLTGETLDGTPLRGCDGVRTVPDMDGDALLDAQEASLGTHDLNPDTDGDGFTDGNEVLVLRSDPLNARDPKPAQARRGRPGRRR
jgi:hypothetical protein